MDWAQCGGIGVGPNRSFVRRYCCDSAASRERSGWRRSTISTSRSLSPPPLSEPGPAPLLDPVNPVGSADPVGLIGRCQTSCSKESSNTGAKFSSFLNAKFINLNAKCMSPSSSPSSWKHTQIHHVSIHNRTLQFDGVQRSTGNQLRKGRIIIFYWRIIIVMLKNHYCYVEESLLLCWRIIIVMLKNHYCCIEESSLLYWRIIIVVLKNHHCYIEWNRKGGGIVYSPSLWSHLYSLHFNA